MKPSKLIGPAVLATITILSIATTTASAATVPNVLPQGTAENPSQPPAKQAQAPSGTESSNSPPPK